MARLLLTFCSTVLLLSQTGCSNCQRVCDSSCNLVNENPQPVCRCEQPVSDTDSSESSSLYPPASRRSDTRENVTLVNQPSDATVKNISCSKNSDGFSSSTTHSKFVSQTAYSAESITLVRKPIISSNSAACDTLNKQQTVKSHSEPVCKRLSAAHSLDTCDHNQVATETSSKKDRVEPTALSQVVAQDPEGQIAKDCLSLNNVRDAEKNARCLLWKAKIAIKCGQIEDAQCLTNQAQKLNLCYGLFNDRPELIQNDIDRIRAGQPEKPKD